MKHGGEHRADDGAEDVDPRGGELARTIIGPRVRAGLRDPPVTGRVYAPRSTRRGVRDHESCAPPEGWCSSRPLPSRKRSRLYEGSRLSGAQDSGEGAPAPRTPGEQSRLTYRECPAAHALPYRRPCIPAYFDTFLIIKPTLLGLRVYSGSISYPWATF